MSRTLAWIIATAALGLVYSLAFTTYAHATERWETNDSGGLARVEVECPPPYRVLIFGDQPADAQADEANPCTLSSRTLALEAGMVALVIGLAVWKPATRTRPQSIEPLSQAIRSSGD